MVTLTGIARPASAGTLRRAPVPNGVQAVTHAGSVTPRVSDTLTGVAGASGVGSLSLAIVRFSGVSGTAEAGTLAVAITQRAILGQHVTASVGSLLTVATVNQSNVYLPNIQIGSGVGSLSTAHTKTLTGVSAGTGTATLGTLAVTVTKPGMTMTNIDVASAIIVAPDTFLTIRWSDSEGQSWSDSVLRSMGEAGEYLTSVQVRRMGMSRRGRVYELSWSAPAPIALAGCTIQFESAAT